MIKEEHEVTTLGGPQGSGAVMSTVVTMQPETVVPDHIVWSLCSSIYFNVCCLGLVAFAYSIKSRDRKRVLDMVGAEEYASTAKKLNIAALLLGVILVIIIISLKATGSV
ncbi:interferon-induced transmembrane protein 2-like [Pteronotus mesoamericanus]|uniref:interferon-induced transmembrane protein 2-like n=1 Tax=Pteronotus mesoamericanus TaxID=1884717 RepID=UPI0023EC94F2|nr:interferon-induced transmembrane protein 2-like [Pteronotus parnellii mesoamericanus]